MKRYIPIIGSRSVFVGERVDGNGKERSRRHGCESRRVRLLRSVRQSWTAVPVETNTVNDCLHADLPQSDLLGDVENFPERSSTCILLETGINAEIPAHRRRQSFSTQLLPLLRSFVCNGRLLVFLTDTAIPNEFLALSGNATNRGDSEIVHVSSFLHNAPSLKAVTKMLRSYCSSTFRACIEAITCLWTKSSFSNILSAYAADRVHCSARGGGADCRCTCFNVLGIKPSPVNPSLSRGSRNCQEYCVGTTPH